MAKKYIKGKDGKFQGSVPDGKSVPKTVKIPNQAAKTPSKKPAGKEWVVSYTLEDGSRVRGVQTAWYGHAAIDFYAKNNNLKYKSAGCESKENFDRFLAEGLREPLETPSEENVITWEEWEAKYVPIQNPRNPDTGLWGCMFETHGDDIQDLHDRQLTNNVYWTLVDSDPNSSYMDLIPGAHYVNRVGYFITEKPWSNERLTVTNNP